MCEVLVVEDDFMVARAHERIVGMTDGFRVAGVAHSGQEGLAMIASLHPDLVLLDMYLPDMTGVEVIRRAREEGADLDFLVLSAAREAEIVGAAIQGGIVSYLLKPFTIGELQARLATYAERRRVLRRAGDITQRDLDLALGSAPSPEVLLPKGLSRETAGLVEDALRRAGDGDLAASECAVELGLSRVVARKYLEHFVLTGKAVVSLRYGQTGRPQRRYSWVAS